MGQNNSHPSGQGRLLNFSGNNSPPPNYDLPPIKFHQTRGENIQLSEDGFTATRHDSFCKGIVFSNRPIMINERVCFRLMNMSSRWSGVLRVGFSNHDPSTISSLPKYACPNLTSKPGYWAKALPERYAVQGNIVHYYVTGNGEVQFGVGGKDLGVFFSGIDTRQPLWAMIDLYGNCTTMEMVDLRSNLNNYSTNSSGGSTRAPSRAGVTRSPPSPVPGRNVSPSASIQVILPPVEPQPPGMPEPSRQPLEGVSSYNTLRSSQSAGNLNAVRQLRHNVGVPFRQLSFHNNVGRNVRLEAGNTVGQRHEEEFAQGYVFTSQTINLGERLVVQILGTEDAYIGSLAFGLTNCDPALIDVHSLPEDSDLLLDRSEYWVVSKDVANSPAVSDELSFQINRDGSVEFSKNGNPPSVFMHVDTSQSLWAFWDIYGHTSKIRLVGASTQPAHQLPRPASANAANRIVSPPSPVITEAVPHSQQNPSECTICFEKGVDCVLYTCGHMCMCYNCALQQWRGRGGGFCPMCRTVIRDVIKIFRS